MPLQMYVYPVVTGTTLPAGVHAVRDAAARPYSIDADDDRREPQRVDRPVDADRAAVTRARAWRVVRVVIPLGVPRRVLRVAGRRDHLAVRSRAGALRDVLDRPRAPARRVVHVLAGGGRDRRSRSSVGLPAAYVVARYEFPGRRLFRAFVTVPFVLPTVVVATAFLVLFRPGGALVVPRLAARRRPAARRGGVLQRRGDRAHRRRVLVEPRSPPHRRGPGARRVPVPRVPRGDAAVARPADRGRRVDRVPVHVHRVRRGAAARRPGARDARGRDLPPGGRAVRLPDRGRARARADRRGDRAAARAGARCRSGARSPSGSSRRATRPAGPAGVERVVVGGVLGATIGVPRRPAARARARSRCASAGAGRSRRTARSARARRPTRCSSRRGRRCATRSSSRRSRP